jgi:predicted transposase YdaD
MAPEEDIRVQLAVLQTIVAQGFTSLNEKMDGTNTRLDKLNGRVYNGEQDRSDQGERLAKLEGRLEDTPQALSKTKVTGIAAGAGGALLFLWELLKPFLPDIPTPP